MITLIRQWRRRKHRGTRMCPMPAMIRAVRFRSLTRLEVVKGRCWISVEADPRDYIMQRGDRIDASARKLVVIEALDSEVLIRVVPHGYNTG